LIRVAVLETVQAKQRQDFVSFVRPVFLGDTLHFKAELDVLPDRPPREGGVLEHHTDIRVRRGDHIILIEIVPSKSDSRPLTAARRVDLPHPDGPRMDTNSPGHAE
jgi:hypothetical protein